ncbi:aryl-alcohol dehydrogenase-like predicted oxidoreductase [Geodermatophilus normandii]|uniref:Aryl-alcohol dehydrogenase-like predicted oxidoreductase n=1 Tax=Geodermatophilus normandii TaxID=1137989 RepID=A0A317QSB4_9ACTN|nr:aldo/keto reductase [Geodermatophilus normandii]PWW24590.1 aryl-alcohol dehydrogenase-like predicted oxidoreductase [Geodermatophilus normandii]
METRPLGRTGADVSVVGLGTWQLGGDWGDVDEETAGDVLDAALDAGVTLLDTADVYGDGRSEERIRKALAARSDRPFVATKAGRRADPFEAEQYTPENLRAWVDRSRRNLGVDTLDLVQLHCPPTAVYSDQRVYDALDSLVADGAIAAYGVSVETVAEGLTALEHPGVQSIQVILNVFRRKPLEELLPAAAARGVGILARVPLASGLLSGRYTESTTFGADDHRNFNRNGEAFDVGETFAGVPYEVGVAAAREFTGICGDRVPAQVALRWVVQQPGVTCVIPGARSVEQARSNAAAADLPPLTDAELADLERLYDERIRPHVHDRW